MASESAWDRFMSNTKGFANLKPLIPEEANDDTYEFSLFEQKFSPAMRLSTEKETESVAIDPESSKKFSWFLCDMPDGEYPKTRQFDTPEALAKAIKRSEGRATTLVAFYGVALPFTKIQVTDDGERYRYLILPDNLALSLGDSISKVDRSLLPSKLDYEDTGWMGDPSFMESEEYFAANETFSDDLVDPFYDEDNPGTDYSSDEE